MFKPVEMIFSSDLEGNLVPIRFRLQVENELIVVQVKYSVLVDNSIPGTPMLNYKADFVMSNQIQPGQLRYDTRRLIWQVKWQRQ